MHQNAIAPNQQQEKYVLQYGRGIETIPAESMGSNTAMNFAHYQQAMLLKERSATIAALYPHDITHLLKALNQQLSESNLGQGRGNL